MGRACLGDSDGLRFDFWLEAKLQACEKIDDRTYIIAFDRTYSLDEVKVFDWVKEDAGMFSRKASRGLFRVTCKLPFF